MALVLNPRFLTPCLAGAFCLIVGTVIGVRYLFTIAMVALALPVASYIVGSLMLRGCIVQRAANVSTTQGDRTGISILVSNSRGSSPPSVALREHTPPTIESRFAEAADTLVDDGWRARAMLWLTPGKRGRYTIGPVHIRILDPLGMFKITRRLTGTTELFVYPRPVRIFPGRASIESQDSGAATTHGTTAARGDFAGVRDYRPGDEIRRIHWKTTARTNSLAVVEYQDPATDTAVVAVDLSSGSDYGRKMITSIDVAVGAAAYALNEHIKERRTVRLLISAGTSFREIRVTKPEQLSLALTALAEASADSEFVGADLLRSSLKHAKATLFITTRSSDSLAAAVREVSASGKAVDIALVDPEPFDSRLPARQWVAELSQAGAQVELVRETLL